MRYNARKVVADGIVFDSTGEHEVYQERNLAQRAGLISKLQVHPTFVFIMNDVTLGRYTPDFSFIDTATNVVHVWDVKGFKQSKKTGKMLPRVDREFGLKKRLMLACFGITVEIV